MPHADDRACVLTLGAIALQKGSSVTRMLVNLTSYTELDNFFQYPAQASAPVTLDAQQPILLEAAHCNGAAAGHVQVRAT